MKAKRMRESDIMPVRKCERKEKKEKAKVKNRDLESLDSTYRSKNGNEEKKKMKPRLLGTEMAPK